MHAPVFVVVYFNTLRHERNIRHFVVDIFKRISLNQNYCILRSISQKLVPYFSIVNKSLLGQKMKSLYRVYVNYQPGLNMFRQYL